MGQSTRHRFITKRACIALVLLLVAGAIFNVAVAWGFAMASDPQHVTTISDTGAWTVMRMDGPGSSMFAAMIQLRSSPPINVDDPLIPAWSRVRHLPAYVEGDPMPMVQDIALGWPALAMWYSIDAQRNWQTGSIVSHTPSGLLDGLGLPLRRVWPGFAINTVFYAVILWLLFASLWALRRRLRVKRGLCLKCAYDLRGRAPKSEVCPECGVVVGVTTPEATSP